MAVYRHRPNLGKGSGKWLFLFLFGFILGIVIINCWKEQFLTEGSMLNEMALARLKYLEVNKTSFLIYVLKKRLSSIWMLALLSTTFLGVIAVYGYMIWLGAGMGFLLSAFIMQYGVKGILLFLAGTFPQYILYIPAMLLLLAWGRQLTVKLYFPQKDISGQYMNRQQAVFRFFIRLLILHGVVITGCLLESYVNPNIITNVLQIF